MGLGKQLFIISIGVVAFSFYSIHQSKKVKEGSVVAYSLPSPPSLDGPLTPNNALTGVEYILKDQIKGPESFVVDGDTIYTGTHDARLLKIVKGKVEKEVKLFKGEKKCGGYESEPQCGRPLGMRRIEGDELIVADAYLGVFRVDFNTGKKTLLIDSRMPIDGELPMFLNDIDIISNDEFLVTDSSTIYGRKDFMREILGSKGTGRVIHHRISTGESKVVVKGLHFANGIQVVSQRGLATPPPSLSLQILPDRRSFVVSECTRARVMRYYLDGPKKGTTEVFIENLPGLPDNIRLSANGTLWVGLAGIRKEGQPNALEALAEYPRIREFLLAMLPDLILRDVFPHLVPPHAIVVQMDVEGRIISTLHDVKGEKMREVSQVSDSGDYLYFGSFKAPYIARLKKF
ncbi:hypothetical protein PMAYCL1PPCAC_07137 [Pristionchus mayeri]|uniref:Strictosidine synthase conserved region domain-containing protein n=1 Tax=Pristionchus mayeri TaxID=1317129 RepID=A0AAN4ZFL2_9BILA|nr:hypothetical protein PMAYCL1PPCAC_07137 [Pristionchus mayeri]